MLPTEQGQESQQGKEMSRLEEHQEDRWVECPWAFAGAVSGSAPALPCHPVPPHRGGLWDALGAKLWHWDGDLGFCRVTPDQEDILIPI